MAIRSQRELGAELSGTLTRDCASAADGQCGEPDATLAAAEARNCIAVIGIDRYCHAAWTPLRNAVNDARGVLNLFEELDFKCIVDPLFDGAATRDALERFVSDDLTRALRKTDSLILFFAGHGHTEITRFEAGDYTKQGYLIPVDAEHLDGSRRAWLRLEHWLSDVARLPARHILVILDSCQSGLALDAHTRWRETITLPETSVLARGASRNGDQDPRRSLRSRHVIASALDGQSAMDGGPEQGHSLFTGCLIRAIRSRLGIPKRQHITGKFLGEYLQEQVSELARGRQTPTTGRLELDAGGELFVPLRKATNRKRRGEKLRSLASRAVRDVAPARERWARGEVDVRRAAGSALDDANTPLPASTVEPATTAAARDQDADAAERTESWTLDPAFVAELDRHGAERARGNLVLSVIGGDAMATQTAWATWAARRGYLTLITEGAELASALADLLAQTPWLRCLAEARKRVANAARLEVDAVDAALDARSPSERRRWIGDVAALDLHALVSGWLLSSLRDSKARVPDLTTAPAQGAELLGIACDLAAPTAVLFRHRAPTAVWLEPAIGMAAALAPHLRHHAVAVTAPDAVLTSVLHGARDSRALTMARQGRVALTKPVQRTPGRGRGRTTRVLQAALAGDPRTRGQFELDAQVALPETGYRIDIDLLARRARIAIELDGWHHFQDPEGYRRDRDQDVRLQRAGYFVMRFLTEDVDDRMASTLDQIAIALAARHASGVLP